MKICLPDMLSGTVSLAEGMILIIWGKQLYVTLVIMPVNHFS
jgi:hypothetical protein